MTSRQELDPIFKELLTHFLAPLPVTVQTEVEVSRLPRTIDLLVIAKTNSAQAQLRKKTPLRYASHHNQIEFKGRNDPLNIKGFARILGRTYLYMGDHTQIKSFDKMSVTIVCAGKPRNLLREQKEQFKMVTQGVYHKEDSPTITIIVANELPIERGNYPFLLFASSKQKFIQFFTQLINDLGSDPDRNPYLHLAYISTSRLYGSSRRDKGAKHDTDTFTWTPRKRC